MSVTHFIEIQPIDTNVNLVLVLEEKSGITKAVVIHPLGIVNVCTKS